MNQTDWYTLVLSPPFHSLRFGHHAHCVGVTAGEQFQVVDHAERRVHTPPRTGLIHDPAHLLQVDAFIYYRHTGQFLRGGTLQVGQRVLVAPFHRFLHLLRRTALQEAEQFHQHQFAWFIQREDHRMRVMVVDEVPHNAVEEDLRLPRMGSSQHHHHLTAAHTTGSKVELWEPQIPPFGGVPDETHQTVSDSRSEQEPLGALAGFGLLLRGVTRRLLHGSETTGNFPFRVQGCHRLS